MFHNLNLLFEICNSCVDSAVSRVVDKTRLAFDARTLNSLNKRIDSTTPGKVNRKLVNSFPLKLSVAVTYTRSV